MPNSQPMIAFIGGGNMASAMIKGLLKGGYATDKIIVSSATSRTRDRLRTQFGIQTAESNETAIQQAELLIIAVKPHQVGLICADINNAKPAHLKQIVSIAAGIDGTHIEQGLAQPYRIITAMPNLPVAIGKGVTCLYNHSGDTRDADQVERVLSLTGHCEWLAQQEDMPAAIAAAGSSPAYFFLILEAMQAQASALGLPPAQAKRLVQQSALGASAMASYSNEDFKTLREQVTSPNGTTHSAIQAFESGGLHELVHNAMSMAAQRAEEIARERKQAECA